MNWWNTSDLLIVINQRDKELDTVRYLARMETQQCHEKIAKLEGELDTHRFLARAETKKNAALIEQLRQEKTDLEQFKNKQIKELMMEIKEWKAEAQKLSDRLSEEGY